MVESKDNYSKSNSYYAYLIESNWYDQWLNYTSSTASSNSNSRKRAKRPRDIPNHLLLISNNHNESNITSSTSMTTSKQELCQQARYRVISKHTWDKLYELYGGGPPLPRPIIHNPGSTPQISVSTHPITIHVHLCDPKYPYRRGICVSSFPIQILVDAQHTKLSQTLPQMAPLLYANAVGVVTSSSNANNATYSDCEVRLWIHRNGIWRLLLPGSTFLTSSHVSLCDYDNNNDVIIHNHEKYCGGHTMSSLHITSDVSMMLEYLPHDSSHIKPTSQQQSKRSSVWPRATSEPLYLPYSSSTTGNPVTSPSSSSSTLQVTNQDENNHDNDHDDNHLSWFRALIKIIDLHIHTSQRRNCDDGDNDHSDDIMIKDIPTTYRTHKSTGVIHIHNSNDDVKIKRNEEYHMGIHVDALTSHGRWYQSIILDFNTNYHVLVRYDTDTYQNMDDNDDVSVEDEWIPLPTGTTCNDISISEVRIAKLGRYSSASSTVMTSSNHNNNNTNVNSSANTSKTKKSSNFTNGTSTTAQSSHPSFPGYGSTSLENLGNTCYLNSALQCLAYTPLLRGYLVSGSYRRHRNVHNVLGSGGKLTDELADLMKVLWSAKCAVKVPAKLRGALVRYNSYFSGNEQHDAQELLSCLLDVIHEDLNLVLKKPYVPNLTEDEEQELCSVWRLSTAHWFRFLRRNRSVVQRCQMGQFVNKLECVICKHSSYSFDPYNLISVPVLLPGVLCRVRVYAKAPNLSAYYNSITDSSTLNACNGTVEDKSEIIQEYYLELQKQHSFEHLMQQLTEMTNLPDHRMKVSVLDSTSLSAPMSKDDNDNTTDTDKFLSTLSTLPQCEASTPLTAELLPQLLSSKEATTERTLTLLVHEYTLVDLVSISQQEKNSNDPTITLSNRTRSYTAHHHENSRGSHHSESNVDKPKRSRSSSHECIKSSKSSSLLPSKSSSVTSSSNDHDWEHAIQASDLNALARRLSIARWPQTVQDLTLGLRVDARDHRGDWYPGSIVNISMDNEEIDDQLLQEQVRIRVHFDLFSSKWDEDYSWSDFSSASTSKQPRLAPLYTHVKPRDRITELPVSHLLQHQVFGSTLYIQLQTEWTMARAAAHILSQLARFLHTKAQYVSPSCEANGMNYNEEQNEALTLLRKYRGHAQRTLRELIRVLLDIDKVYAEGSLQQYRRRSSSSHNKEQQHSVDGNILNASLARKIDKIMRSMPFRLMVMDPSVTSNSATENQTQSQKNNSDGIQLSPFPMSILHTLGNYFHPKLAVYVSWFPVTLNVPSRVDQDVSLSFSTAEKSKPLKPKESSTVSSTVCLYNSPVVKHDMETFNKLGKVFYQLNRQRSTKSHFESTSNGKRRNKPSVKLNACLSEFCKEQFVQHWRCPKCAKNNEVDTNAKGEKFDHSQNQTVESETPKVTPAKQSLSIWKLPDLLTIHVKRFHIANNGGWREKIVSHVDFPLNGLDMSPWLHPSSPENNSSGGINVLYDLVGVVNHIGGLTGGHYVASCRASPCGADGYEEVAHSFNGAWSTSLHADFVKDNDISNIIPTSTNTTGKASFITRSRQQSLNSINIKGMAATKVVLNSEISPLWLQFDDEIVEPLQEKDVCSEAAYVLFYRRRRLSPANCAKYGVVIDEN